MESNYAKYRGKCKEYVDAAIKENPTLQAVRGFYHCPIWGEQQHWWCMQKDGTIYDPTVKQFPTAGVGAVYEEFDGNCTCEECGKKFPEKQAVMAGRYPTCSNKCALKLVGL